MTPRDSVKQLYQSINPSTKTTRLINIACFEICADLNSVACCLMLYIYSCTFWRANHYINMSFTARTLFTIGTTIVITFHILLISNNKCWHITAYILQHSILTLNSFRTAMSMIVVWDFSRKCFFPSTNLIHSKLLFCFLSGFIHW